jgi:hypothetical protein
MSLELYIHTAFLRKALSIFLIVFVGIGFSFGGALATGCQGGADCLICAEQPHGHIPGTAASMENPDCPSGGQNSPCGFEASQDPDEFRGIVSAVRSYHQAYAGIFAAVSDEYGQIFLPNELAPQFLLFDTSGTAPIYLLNQTLLY